MEPQTTHPRRSRQRTAQRRLVQTGLVVCGVVAGLVEFLALQRRRLVGRHHRDARARLF